MTARTVAVIPARFGSTRFPGKPLAAIAGRPMIQWVYERAAQAQKVDDVIVATDDQRIVEAVEAFGGTAVMTAADHATGTDRIAEAVTGVNADIVVNLQGDEPLLPPSVIDKLIDAMQESGADMGTAAVPFGQTQSDPLDPNCVKVVVDDRGFALYFSRSLIPFSRNGGVRVEPLLHWGLYAYKRDFLEQFVRWPQGRLEKCELLEQLRALENGAAIRVIEVQEVSMGVDVPADIAKVERLLRQRGEI
jgi:3-deoxy-manno-octulosonate cytidylyltransferase (CMP-KDO synthetase)